MAERAFAGKLERAGFTDVWVGGHRSFGIDQAALYPLFTREVIEVMRQTIPPDHQDHVATGVIVKARKPWSNSPSSTRHNASVALPLKVACQRFARVSLRHSSEHIER